MQNRFSSILYELQNSREWNSDNLRDYSRDDSKHVMSDVRSANRQIGMDRSTSRLQVEDPS